MFSYVAYSLAIRSALPLPELSRGVGGAKVDLRLGSLGRLPSKSVWTGCRLRVTGDDACLFWDGVGGIRIQGGERIIIEPAPGVEARLLRLFVLGPALALLLHQRGRLVLHASAVTMHGGAVAFLGGPGWGKSTLAAALYARGHGILADDVTALEVDGASPMAIPGFPQLKLWPEALVSLGEVPERLPRLHPRLEKRARRADRGFPQASLPLRTIYVLTEGEADAIEPLEPRDALLELVRHSYCARLLNGRDARHHFLQCAAVAARVPVSRLKRQRSLHALPSLVQVVEEDLARSNC